VAAGGSRLAATRTGYWPSVRPLVCVGGSAGALEALRILLRGLPADLSAPVVVVVHTPPGRQHRLAAVLGRAGPLPARLAEDGQELERGVIYVAPSDRHLLICDEHVELDRGPTVNRVRPAIDPLFTSAAASHDGAAVGVVLSGVLDDGTAGLIAIGQAGGRTLVQDPRDALHPEMPAHAARYGDPDAILTAADLATAIVAAVTTMDGRTSPTAPAETREEHVSGLTCPLCAGALWEQRVGELTTFRCRIGHRLSQASMVRQHDEMVENALWAGVRALEERAALAGLLASRLAQQADTAGAGEQAARAEQATKDAAAMREIVER
jgi:two-component system, chemotaxis family, protein-glutamate methylesterase/glutaminase